MNTLWKGTCGACVFLVVIGMLFVAGGGPRIFTEEMPLEELQTRVTVTNVLDGQYTFAIDRPHWRKHSDAKKALYEFIEKWLAHNNREALSIEHRYHGYYITMVTREKT